MPHRSQFEFLDGVDVESKAEVITQASILQPCQFPASNERHVPAQTPRMHQIDISASEKLVSEITKHRLSTTQWIQAAWAILLRCYLGSDAVCFGILPVRRDDPLVNRQLWLSKFDATTEALACQLQLSAEDAVLSTIQWVCLSRYPRKQFEDNNTNTALTLPLSFPSRHRYQDINHYVQHKREKSAPDVRAHSLHTKSLACTGEFQFRFVIPQVLYDHSGMLEEQVKEFNSRCDLIFPFEDRFQNKSTHISVML
jgi:hypothetical protein